MGKLRAISNSTNALKRNSLFLLLIVGGYVLQYGVNLLLARNLSTEAYGDISVVLRTLVLLIPIMLLGTGQSLFLFVPELRKYKQIAHLHGLLRWDMSILLRSSLVVSCLAFVVLVVDIALEHFGVKTMYDYHPVIYALWLLPLAAFNLFLANLCRSFDNYVFSIVSSYGMLIIAAALFSLVVVFFDNISAYHILVILGLGYFSVIMLQLLYFRKDWQTVIKPVSPQYKKPVWRKLSLELMLDNIFFLAVNTLDLLLLELLGSREHEVALFSVVLVIIAFLRMLSDASEPFFLNKVQLAVKEARKQELQALLDDNHRFQIPLVSLTMVGLIVFAPYLLSHFGSGYRQAYGILVVMAIAEALLGYAVLVPALLTYSGNDRKLFKVKLISIAMLLVISGLLIPWIHIWGAVVSYISVRVFFVIGSSIIARRHLGIRCWVYW